MWNEVLGALAITVMIIIGANASKLSNAFSDRIRYGIQPAVDDDPDAEEPTEAPVKPATVTTGKTSASAKPTAARAVA